MNSQKIYETKKNGLGLSQNSNDVYEIASSAISSHCYFNIVLTHLWIRCVSSSSSSRNIFSVFVCVLSILKSFCCNNLPDTANETFSPNSTFAFSILKTYMQHVSYIWLCVCVCVRICRLYSYLVLMFVIEKFALQNIMNYLKKKRRKRENDGRWFACVCWKRFHYDLQHFVCSTS